MIYFSLIHCLSLLRRMCTRSILYIIIIIFVASCYGLIVKRVLLCYIRVHAYFTDTRTPGELTTLETVRAWRSGQWLKGMYEYNLNHDVQNEKIIFLVKIKTNIMIRHQIYLKLFLHSSNWTTKNVYGRVMWEYNKSSSQHVEC